MTMRSPVDLLVTHAALGHMVETDFMQIFTDEALDSPEFKGQIKNVCAKVSAQLSDDIDQVCGFLHISKRKFLEAAFIEAVDKARRIIEAEGVNEYFSEKADAQPKAKDAKK